MTYIIGRYSLMTEEKLQAARDITRDYLRLLGEHQCAPAERKKEIKLRLNELENQRRLIMGDEKPWERLVL